jgi:hypothetical protein
MLPEVVPSFFPTSNEVAGGIKWLREHPVVLTAAAAAATAVSVISFLKTQPEEEEDKVIKTGTSRGMSSSINSRRHYFMRPAATWSEDSTFDEDSSLNHEDDTLEEEEVEDEEKKNKEVCTRCIINGQKSIKELEHENHSVESDAVTEESSTSTTMSCCSECISHQQHPLSRDNAFSNTNNTTSTSSNVRLLGRNFEEFMAEVDINSASPQWGWYVSTTPPEEYYT